MEPVPSTPVDSGSCANEVRAELTGRLHEIEVVLKDIFSIARTRNVSTAVAADRYAESVFRGVVARIALLWRASRKALRAPCSSTVGSLRLQIRAAHA